MASDFYRQDNDSKLAHKGEENHMIQHEDYIRKSGRALYWPEPQQEQAVTNLPILKTERPFKPEWVYVRLPLWAKDLEVGGKGLLVDIASCQISEPAQWDRVDWWSAAFHYLNGTYERQLEKKRKRPLHSYSFRLPDTHPDLFEHAWVNRIFLFLRRWAAYKLDKNENDIFPRLQTNHFHLTYDVDYISKTVPLIIKKTAFDGLKFFKCLARLKLKDAALQAKKSLIFVATLHKYEYYKHIIGMENESGHTGTFHFHAGKNMARQSWLFDPSYDIKSAHSIIKTILENDRVIGLHPSFHCWENTTALTAQKGKLENHIQRPVLSVRQHWLRFSWLETWNAQYKAGLTRDTTLMWNDRPGFRNGAAMWFTPLWNEKEISGFQALPTVAMDSHFFDYDTSDSETQFTRLKHYIDEVKFVGGQIATVWHPHTFHPEYSWGGLYQKMLNYIKVPDATE